MQYVLLVPALAIGVAMTWAGWLIVQWARRLPTDYRAISALAPMMAMTKRGLVLRGMLLGGMGAFIAIGYPVLLVRPAAFIALLAVFGACWLGLIVAMISDGISNTGSQPK